MVEFVICECGKVVTVNQYNGNHRNTKRHIDSFKKKREQKERKEEEQIMSKPKRETINFPRFPHYFIYDRYYGKD